MILSLVFNVGPSPRIKLVNQTDLEGNNGLHAAVRGYAVHGKTDAIELVLSLGVEVNHVNKNDETPLDLAIRNGSAEVVALLLAHGAKRNSKLEISKLDQKIANTLGHIEHLKGQLAHRKTHGGKAFRAKKISIENQISEANERLKHLQKQKPYQYLIRN